MRLEGLLIPQAKTREIFDEYIYIHIYVKTNLHLYTYLQFLRLEGLFVPQAKTREIFESVDTLSRRQRRHELLRLLYLAYVGSV